MGVSRRISEIVLRKQKRVQRLARLWHSKNHREGDNE